jgi:hypothetical protein
MCAPFADVAQLVEHHLAKVRVAGSNPVVRSQRTRWLAACGRLISVDFGIGLWGPYHIRTTKNSDSSCRVPMSITYSR